MLLFIRLVCLDSIFRAILYGIVFFKFAKQGEIFVAINTVKDEIFQNKGEKSKTV